MTNVSDITIKVYFDDMYVIDLIEKCHDMLDWEAYMKMYMPDDKLLLQSLVDLRLSLNYLEEHAVTIMKEDHNA